MVICKFFLNGNCRYGDNCFNEHTTRGGNVFSQNSGGGQRRPLVQPSKFGSGDASGTGFSFTRALNEPSVGQAAAKSVRFSDDGSSSRYFQSSNPFAGGAQAAPTTGFSFSQTLNMMGQAPAPSIFGGSSSINASPLGQPPAFTQPVAVSPFGQPQQQQQFPAFGQQPQPVSGFGQPSLFQQATSFPAFGQPATFSSPLGGFGQPPAFGYTPAAVAAFGQVSPFGTQQQQPATPSPFGQALQQQSPPAFGPTVFGTQVSPFGQPVSEMTAFGQVAQKPTASDLFAQKTSYSSGATLGQSTTLFGNQIPSSNPADVDPRAFSKMEELSEADLAAFRSATFEFGKIPLLPPPIELCS